MGYYRDYEDDVEVLNDQALRTLVENHREEYEELLAQTQSARISELEDQVRDKERAITKLREALARSEAARGRSKERIATGVTQRRRSK